jgi:hypothetical protein
VYKREGCADPFLKGKAFDPKDITAMSMALNDICQALEIDGNETSTAIVAERLIELARRGERVLSEARGDNSL